MMSTVAVIDRAASSKCPLYFCFTRENAPLCRLQQLALMRMNASLVTFPYIVKFASNFVDTNIIDYDTNRLRVQYIKFSN